MGKKKSFVLRINQEMYDVIERWAADEFRSVNGQIEYMLHQAIKTAGRKMVAGKETGEEKK